MFFDEMSEEGLIAGKLSGWLFQKMSITKCCSKIYFWFLRHFHCRNKIWGILLAPVKCLLWDWEFPKRFSLLFRRGGKLIRSVPCMFEIYFCPLSLPLRWQFYSFSQWHFSIPLLLAIVLTTSSSLFVSGYLLFCILMAIWLREFYSNDKAVF